MSWTYHPDLLATPVPRYTSYPTAAEFHDGVGERELADALAAVPEQAQLSLYLHIPYCEEICWYCGCNTGKANKASRLASYLDALHAEIMLVGRRLQGRGRVTRIAFGGGSPNAIPPAEFARLLDRLAGEFRLAEPELSVELDPRTLTPDWLKALAAAGVQRASLGVQTLVPAIQARIGRIQSEASIRKAVAGLREAGVTSLNFDLMYGLPGQTARDLGATLAAAVSMEPDRIALFGYAHVPHLIPRQRRIDSADLPDAETRFRQAEQGYLFLTEAGYRKVGFDHFALPHDPLAVAARLGTLRRNFQGFTDDRSGYLIGLGASAISSFPDRLLQNEKNAGRYRMLTSGGRLAATRGILRTPADMARARIIEALLCRGSADFTGVCVGDALTRLQPFREAGLVACSAGRLFLQPGALPYARAIAACFDPYRQSDPRRFSSAV
jgi:oxygen-independent coproporphyrinogen III oxidase